ncbi:MAG TPA: hypothetical protein VMM38_01420 [Aridibacter sp.]|nr:hypothetical protein [Aridibacter sp.]
MSEQLSVAETRAQTSEDVIDNSPEMTAEDLQKYFPAIETAYPLALDSYAAITRRVEVANQRLQYQATFLLSISGLFPVILRSFDVPLFSTWFLLVMLGLALALAFAVYPQVFSGHLQLVHPTHLFNDHLDLEPLEFKKNMIFFAGKDFEKNNKLLERQHTWLLRSVGAFAVSAGLLAVWAVAGRF